MLLLCYAAHSAIDILADTDTDTRKIRPPANVQMSQNSVTKIIKYIDSNISEKKYDPERPIFRFSDFGDETGTETGISRISPILLSTTFLCLKESTRAWNGNGEVLDNKRKAIENSVSQLSVLCIFFSNGPTFFSILQ